MEGMNKIISLFLGLVVVIILFSIVTGRFTPFKSKTASNTTAKVSMTPTPTIVGQKKFLGIFNIGKKPTITPTPTTSTIVVDTTTQGSTSTYNQNNSNNSVVTTTIQKSGSVTTIPATGAPTAVLPLVSSALLAGVYLRKRV